jgi:glycerol-3-phosphate acyltransferase PlsY
MKVSALALILLAYLVGSVPFSHLLAKWRTGLTLREVGEGNVGSRNVWHVVGPAWGALALLLDALKGLLTYLCGALLQISPLGLALAGIAVIMGHQFPLFLRGQGGKGLGTTAGFLLGLSPLSTLAGLAAMGLADLLFFHDFNRSVIVAAVGIILLPLVFGQPLWVAVYALGLGLLIGVKKLLDRPHEQRVWASHPWQGTAKPGFHQEGGDEPSLAPDPGKQ